jgi:hypothetical protein
MLQLKQTRQNGFHRMDNGLSINEEDKKLLLALLREYSDKLNGICAEIEQHTNPYSNRFLLFFLVFIALTLIFLGLQITSSSWQNIYYSGVTTVLIIAYFYLKRPRHKKTFLLTHGKILGIKVERLMQTVSEFSEDFQSNYVKKLELELRLSDAESALAYCNMVCRQIEPQKNKAAKKPLVKD